MSPSERIAAILTPDLGAITADSVARHLCAKYHVGDGPIEPETALRLQETIRKGLVAFVGPDRAAELARQCFEPRRGG